MLPRLPALTTIFAARKIVPNFLGGFLKGGAGFFRLRPFLYPGLHLGGPLQPDASGRGTGVFINGREIHPQELLKLQQSFGAVNPGRYWLNPQGIGGYEGGPAQFNLMPARGAAGQGGSGEAGYNVNAVGASLGSDGNCSYAMLPDGSSVMTGNC